ncbi:MAG: T9SS type A sorting domain-containing protein [Bacteroidales bacterium]|nr:T9SS type A sorting domain-containing protein [Bacteroidales bacterium]
MAVRHKLILLALFSFMTRAGYSQPWYFNEVYNPNGTWAIGGGIIGMNNGYFGCALSGDSISDYYYNTSTFIINPEGEITSWKNFGKDGCDFWAGDEGGLTINNNCYGLFGTVDDYLNDSIYGLFYKFDNSGDTILTKTFTSDSDTIFVGRICTTTNDGGFALLGNISGNEANKDIILIKTDSNGNELWRNQYGSDSSDWAKSLIQTSDNGYAIGSWRRIPYIGYEETADPIVYKTDSLGNYEWFLNLGGPFLDDKPMLCNSQDSCIIVLTAYADSMITPEYAYTRTNLIKISLQGDILWNKKYKTSQTLNYISNIICLENGDLLACGDSRISTYLPHAGWLFRFNSNGDSLWYRDYFYYPEDPSFGTNYLYDVSQTSDNGFVATGQAYTLDPPNNVQKMWVLKVDSVGCEIENCWVGIEEEQEHGGMEAWERGGLFLWPNPARDQIQVRFYMDDGRFYKDLGLEIYDIFGREVGEINLPSPAVGESQGGGWTVDVSAYPPGIYLVRLRDGKLVRASAKFVVVR